MLTNTHHMTFAKMQRVIIDLNRKVEWPLNVSKSLAMVVLATTALRPPTIPELG